MKNYATQMSNEELYRFKDKRTFSNQMAAGNSSLGTDSTFFKPPGLSVLLLTNRFC
jgi:hypothetical protein